MTTTTKNAVGRPSKYSTQLGVEIAGRIMMGDSLRNICSDEAMPDKATLCRWLSNPDKYAEFGRQYRMAREVQADFMMDEILRIADDDAKDVIETDKGPKPNYANLQRARLRIGARKWAASHFLPKSRGVKEGLENMKPLHTKPFEIIVQQVPEEDSSMQSKAMDAMQYAAAMHEAEPAAVTNPPEVHEAVATATPPETAVSSPPVDPQNRPLTIGYPPEWLRGYNHKPYTNRY